MEAVSPVVRVIEALRALREWATVDSRLQEHRERWEQNGIPISVEEARVRSTMPRICRSDSVRGIRLAQHPNHRENLPELSCPPLGTAPTLPC